MNACSTMLGFLSLAARLYLAMSVSLLEILDTALIHVRPQAGYSKYSIANDKGRRVSPTPPIVVAGDRAAPVP